VNERNASNRRGKNESTARSARSHVFRPLAALWLVLACTNSASTEATAPVAAEPIQLPGSVAPRAGWDLNGVIGSGQSLSVGAQAADVASSSAPFANLKLDLGGVNLPPFDAERAELSLVPLVEPIRPLATTYPSAYPNNIYGETPHTAMASQISALVRAASSREFVSVHSVVGENGQGMPVIDKRAVEKVDGDKSTGRAYAATLFEVAAITRLAKARGQTYGVGAIILTHGESDAGNAAYESDLVRLSSDYNQDIKAITGQTENVLLLITQQHSIAFSSGAATGASASTLAQWHAGVSHPDDIVCVGPRYQYPHAADTVHFGVRGYQLLGEKYGQVYFERVVLGRRWRPLEPLEVSAEGRVVSVRFHVPVPPLAWDESLPAPHQTALGAWKSGRGFELRDGNTPIEIESVAIAGDTVRITSARDLPARATLGYAATSDGSVPDHGSRRGGQLRDSDPFVGELTRQAQPNYAVAFEWPLP
jgi:hypothetical protein